MSHPVIAATLCLFCAASFAGTASDVCILDVQFRDPEVREINRLMIEQRLVLNDLRSHVADAPPSDKRTTLEKELAVLEARVRAVDPGFCLLPDRAAFGYMKEVVTRIEECGTRNFPSENGRPIYGRTLASLVVNAAGEIVASSVERTSGEPSVDAHALRILAASAPFGSMPESILDGRFQGFKLQASFDFHRHETAPRTEEPKQRCSLNEKNR